MPDPVGGLYPSPTLYPGIPDGPFTTLLLESMASWVDPAGALTAYNEAIGSMFDPVAEIVYDVGSPDQPATYTPGWSVLLDPDNCPTQYLPYCSQFNGTGVQPGTADADARSLIKSEAGFNRGTPSAIVTAAKRFLTGTQSCILLERTPDPYSIAVIVRPEQVIDLTKLTNAVLAVKPAGIVLAVIQTDGWVIFQMEASQATLSALEANFATITGLEGDQVGH